MQNNLGYTKNLFILPFDHRGSFEKEFKKETISNLKQIIYEAFQKAIINGIPKEYAAILVDEEYGDTILKDAKREGFTMLLTTEKSGQKEFAFEYGNDFGSHIEKYNPTFVKALIRYKTIDPLGSKKRQQKNLKILSDYCHNHGYKFLLEMLISQYKELSAEAACQVIQELQSANIEPDVWKMEGMRGKSDYQKVVEQIRKEGRKAVSLVILGRGEDEKTVEHWIEEGAKIDGVIGFAIGRTIFWDPLLMYRDGKINREQTIGKISNEFMHFYNLFISQSKKLKI